MNTFCADSVSIWRFIGEIIYIVRIVVPVIEKVGSIINKHIVGHNVDLICLVGGTVCLDGFENIIEKETKIKTIKPKNPFLVTPLGIAMSLIDNKTVEV